MRQAILLDPADLAALKAGTPLTIQVGGAELLILMNRGVAPPEPEAERPNGTRRHFTEATRRTVLAEYAAAPSKIAYLKRHKLSTSMIWVWKRRLKRLKGGK